MDGERWSYTISGHGDRVILLLPGGLAVSDSLFHLIEPLEKTHRVLAISWTLSVTAVDALTDAVVAVMNAEQIARVDVVGSSYGGWLAQELAARHPERVRTLVLVHTFHLPASDTRSMHWRGSIAAAIQRLMPQRLFDTLLRKRADRILLAPLTAAKHADLQSWQQLVDEAVANGVLRAMTVHQLAVSRSVPSAPRDAGTARTPVLIVESDDDPIVRRAARAALRHHHPRAVVKTFAGTGHITSILSTEQLVDLVECFVRGGDVT